jgi:hypothetical protein
MDPQPVAERAVLIVGFSGFQLVGALVLSRRVQHPMGWLLSAVALFAALSFALTEYAAYALVTEPDSLPAGKVAGWFASWLWYPTLVLALVYIPLLFPDGHLLSRRWRWLGLCTAGVLVATCIASAFSPTLEVGIENDGDTIANPLAIGFLEPALDLILVVSFPIFAVAVLLTTVSVVQRFRASRGDQRQQMKWFAVGVLLLALSIPADEISYAVGGIFFAVGLLAVPVSIAIAIFRYRLYDIDRIINRTLTYGLLTATLGATYFGLVVGLQEVLRPVGGGSDFAIVVTTLVVAALFLPARRRLQGVVDRRFNRRRYDAARTMEAFSARLREQIDLDSLRYELLSVIDETMQPRNVSLWLRDRNDLGTV